MSATHVVLRPISGAGGIPIPPGTLVEGDTWRNVDVLERIRHIRRLTPEDFIKGGIASPEGMKAKAQRAPEGAGKVRHVQESAGKSKRRRKEA